MLLFCGEIEVYPSDNRLLNFHPFISLKVYGSEQWLFVHEWCQAIGLSRIQQSYRQLS
jgi:hypothetical protein